MDSPLNLAHQQSRKADAELKAGRFDEAISCHNRAADYLLQAMKLTKCMPALESIKLQHAHHLKQTDKIYDRQRRAQLLQIKQNKLQHHNQASQTDIQGPISPGNSDHSSGLSHDNPHSSALDDDNIYRTLTEQDSLIGLLLRRRQNPDEIPQHSLHSGVPVERVFFSKDAEGKRVKRTDSGEIEELRCLNEDLRKHVTQLVEENEKLKKANKQAKEADIVENLFSDIGYCDTIDLPPLEMPTFDMNLLNTDTDQDREDSFDASGLGKSPI